MPRCCACGESPERPEDLSVARNSEGRWVTLCANCRQKGISAATLDPAPDANESEMARPAEPAVKLSGRAFDNVARVFAYLRAIRQKSENRKRVRAHDRHSIELTIRFQLARDDVFNTGVIRDISRGGLRLVTARQLERGQHIQFDPDTLLPPALADLLKGSAEVRRTNTLPDGQCEAGIRFVQRMVAKADNRRRHKRYQCSMRAYFLRNDSTIMIAAAVTDISQGGLQLRTDEKLDMNEKVLVRVRGDSGSFIRGDLYGTIETRRVLPRGAEWEVGCMFQQTRVDPRPIQPERAPSGVTMRPPPASSASPPPPSGRPACSPPAFPRACNACPRPASPAWPRARRRRWSANRRRRTTPGAPRRPNASPPTSNAPRRYACRRRPP